MTDFGSTALANRPVPGEAEQDAKPDYRPPTAELAECTCPDLCERDHDND